MEPMDLRRDGSSVLGLCMVVTLLCCEAATGNVVFEVHHKYGGDRRATLSALKAHDTRRHGRILSAVDFQLGGNAKVTDAALYYAKVDIGTPPKDYYLQVDTGSDILWVNCDGNCNGCSKKSSLGLELKPYNLKDSETGKKITCDQDYCTLMFDGAIPNCTSSRPCDYAVTYADGSVTQGYFVTDNIILDQVSGNLQTVPMNGTFSFGCSSKQSGTLGTSTDRVNGIIGFGRANSSILSQLADSRKIKKIFSHCLDGTRGGIFAIGEVVEPQVQSTPLVPYVNHYAVIMKKVEIDGEMIDVPTESFFSTGRKTVIDSGATLGYFPDDVYNLLIGKIMAEHSSLKTYPVEPDFTCFNYGGNVDEGFAAITFHFKDSLTLKVYPHEYLLKVEDDQWCLGWHKGGMQNNFGEEQILLGDIVLSNKLVVYDLEEMTLGWIPYDCRSSIKVKDEGSGNVFTVGAHDISPPSSASSFWNSEHKSRLPRGKQMNMMERSRSEGGLNPLAMAEEIQKRLVRPTPLHSQHSSPCAASTRYSINSYISIHLISHSVRIRTSISVCSVISFELLSVIFIQTWIRFFSLQFVRKSIAKGEITE